MRIFLVGFGVVGHAFVKLLRDDGARLFRDHALSPRLVGVADSSGAAVCDQGLDPATLLTVKRKMGAVSEVPEHGVPNGDIPLLIAASEADVVIEASPTRIAAPADAMNNIKAAFAAGKHVITVNKAPLALAMPALMELADYNRVQFRFSGTVGGGTPVLAWARECARGDDVVAIRGVLNGTTNFILTKMHESAARYDEALAEAVRLGYAETDPSADVDGIDAATKVVILANLIMQKKATLADVRVTGIRDLPRERIDGASMRSQVVKLIGSVEDGLSVAPQTISQSDPLNVPGSLNAVTLTLRAGGDVTIVGRGAGGVETATAILRDLLDIWRCMSSPDSADKPGGTS